MADFGIKTHDTLPALRVQLQKDDGSGAAVDLSTATSVEFVMATAVGATPKVNAVCTVEAPASSGIVRYDWVTADTDTSGKFLGEFEVTWTGGKKQTFPTGAYLSIDINPDLDGA